jgi:hypothetical protein
MHKTMKQISSEDRREFSRFPMDLQIDIVGVDHAGESHEESSCLKDISGGGAKFTTRCADQYEPGKRLVITIYMPGISHVWARMKGEATVVRIERHDDEDESGTKADIALCFNSRLRLIRE